MILTIDLPEELASRLNELLPEEERVRFAVAAIAHALVVQERDSAECIAAVEEAIAEMETGRTIALKDERARWEKQKAELVSKNSVHLS